MLVQVRSGAHDVAHDDFYREREGGKRGREGGEGREREGGRERERERERREKEEG